MSLEALPRAAASGLPWLAVEEMREVDRIMIEELGIVLTQMMENAGRNLAVVARALLGGSAAGRTVAVLVGGGGNGGGGMVAARHLAVAGARVVVCCSAPSDDLAEVPRRQAQILRAMGVPVLVGATREIRRSELVVDAVLGYSLRGAPRGTAADLLAAAAGARVLALDVPSGVELSTGTAFDGALRATVTMTLAAPKEGLRAPGAVERVGRLLLADISVPPAVYGRLGHRAPPFGAGPLLRVGPG